MATTPQLTRKSSTPWERLKPAKHDPLQSMGFVSKGDTRLLDVKVQESFYNKIVARYMQFCTHHSTDMESAFASLSLEDDVSASSDPARNPPVAPVLQGQGRPITPSPPKRVSSSPLQGGAPSTPPPPAQELSIILLALRKLREALLATSSSAPSPIFSQRVHVFCVRLAILAFHPPSYHPPLMHLLFVLHTPRSPLPAPELSEMTTYLILDLACRQQELASAFSLRSNSRLQKDYRSRNVDEIIRAVVTSNWVAFWRVRRNVDGYVRALMQWSVPSLRRNSLKALSRAYLSCDLEWVLQSATGAEMSWEELVKIENIGWVLEGSKVVVRKPKPKSNP
ncbi:hypothetical protein EPUS_07128 [Endocarpon pusillum Z07020]|uniref:CSN8/PSMD8/EIF3K domain-containing protein n=1 Tax=Endocarpon pusillum (strain Z07020 / HMAS-L-300199) TaxID=1263415 RepID=U1HUN9_ENDPU|nr:uncharacterized protein EPUS_07128 [Endocarpon pusillum Z07020]ERF73034.1 hypothetical protein EPUS_07128 [Endocarpon pusillum Z07020]